MKKRLIPLVTLALVLSGITVVHAVTPAEKPGEAATDHVIKVDGIKDCFQTGDFYISGQPNLETLRWLKSQGVTLVVNLRTENENKEFTATSFNEESVLKELGIAYCLVPIGEKESYSPKNLDKVAEALKVNKGKALIHCTSAGRATHLWMAYLVRYRGYSLNDAVTIGKQLKFTFPLEDFLGVKISLTAEDMKK